MTDSRTPREIEKEIEHHRAQLAANLEALQESLGLDSLVEKVGGFIKKNGSAVGQSMVQVVKEKPLAIAMTGIGLYWLLSGSDRKKAAPVNNKAQNPSEQWQRSLPSWASDRNEAVRRAHRNFGSNQTSQDQADRGTVDALRNSLDHATNQLGDSLASATTAVRSRIQQTSAEVGDSLAAASSAVGDKWHDTRELIAEKTDALRERLSEGTENLSDEARDRIIAARAKALQALQGVQQAAHTGSEKAVDFFESQPFVVGALALAAGAALGGSLPTTKVEDQTLGQYSDALVHEAERIFFEEKHKAEQVASTTVEKAKDISSELKADLQDQVEEGIHSGAEKIQDLGAEMVETVKTEAKNQQLGKPKL